jgi:hypothetical protein
VLTEWINLDVVRQALAVDPEARYVSGDNSAALNYSLSEPNLIPFHRHVATSTDVRTLIMNGDTDPGLKSLVAEWWVNELGLDRVEDWRAWTVDGKKRVGGYVTTYQGDFWFATVRGSGHMIPNNRALEAYVLLDHFLQNKPLPYNRPSGDQAVLYAFFSTKSHTYVFIFILCYLKKKVGG